MWNEPLSQERAKIADHFFARICFGMCVLEGKRQKYRVKKHPHRSRNVVWNQ